MTSPGEIRQDLARTTLAVICLVLLIVGSLWVLRPFLAATIWATMLVVATWPILESVEARLGHRRAPAVALMTVGLVFLLVLPLWLAFDTISGHRGEVSEMAKRLADSGLPKAPEWVAKVPFVGTRLAATLDEWAAAGPAGLEASLRPYASDAARWAVSGAGSLGGTLVQLVLVVLLSTVMYSSGEAGARGMRRFGRRLAGQRGEDSIILAGKAIRGVALGVGVTAVVQTVLGGIGLAVAGVPFASVLSAVMLILCIAQIGPSLILFPSVAWMYWMGDDGWATFLLVWSVIVAALDNVLRPVLIKKGADLPLLLIFGGVVGGLLGFGLIGIFVGPVILAVSYTLVGHWVDEIDEVEGAGDTVTSDTPTATQAVEVKK
ncbi:MAG TPA: AI-2E family transporter YdiK [Vicinamibacteria bacterium]|nr:AI-2E family transporter YdiK [Vicinamibacteria bacterium]